MERLREQRPEQYEFFANQTGFDPITGAATAYVPPTFDVAGAVGGGQMPASGVRNNNDDAPSHAEIMRMHNRTGPAVSADPRASSPRPVLRGESTGGLFSGLREAKNKTLDALGFI